VQCVVNYDVPDDPTVYFHRVGRTARAGDIGRSYTFVSTEDAMDFARILRMAKSPIKPLRPEDAARPLPTEGSSRPPRRRPPHGGRWRPPREPPRWKKWRS
jgi:ATP-dependent RNA helicase DeaD